MATTELHTVPSADGPHHRLIAWLIDHREGEVSDVARQLWEHLAQQLVVLIGQEGFHALYDRSLHLASASFPWLTLADATAAQRPRLEALACALHDRPTDEAQNATVEQLSTFTGLLNSLIGHKLTTNILRTAWGDAFEQAVQEVAAWAKK